MKLCKKSALDKILRTHVVLQVCILYRVTLWTFWRLFVLIMLCIILLFWISRKFSPTPTLTPYHLAFLYLGLITIGWTKLSVNSPATEPLLSGQPLAASCPFLESGHLKKVSLSQGSTAIGQIIRGLSNKWLYSTGNINGFHWTPHFLSGGDLKISIMLCSIIVSDHDLKYEVY